MSDRPTPSSPPQPQPLSTWCLTTEAKEELEAELERYRLYREEHGEAALHALVIEEGTAAGQSTTAESQHLAERAAAVGVELPPVPSYLLQHRHILCEGLTFDKFTGGDFTTWTKNRKAYSKACSKKVIRAEMRNGQYAEQYSSIKRRDRERKAAKRPKANSVKWRVSTVL